MDVDSHSSLTTSFSSLSSPLHNRVLMFGPCMQLSLFCLVSMFVHVLLSLALFVYENRVVFVWHWHLAPGMFAQAFFPTPSVSHLASVTFLSVWRAIPLRFLSFFRPPVSLLDAFAPWPLALHWPLAHLPLGFPFPG